MLNFDSDFLKHNEGDEVKQIRQYFKLPYQEMVKKLNEDLLAFERQQDTESDEEESLDLSS